MKCRSTATISILLLISFINIFVNVVAKDDVDCLRGFKSSISDPDGVLSSWDFTNITAGSVCKFAGVNCWNDQDNRVISISINSSSISGQIPSSLQYCKSISSVVLSGNSLSGPIPTSLCQWLPYLVKLDLSSNSLTGSIPLNISNCSYLHILLLNSNQLSGSIPSTLGMFVRLKKLNVSSNWLSGQIPPGLSAFGASAFQDNPTSLCGYPLPSCDEKLTTTGLVIILAAGVLGAVQSFALSYFIWRFFFSASSVKKNKATTKTRVEAAVGREDAWWWLPWHRTSHHRIDPVSVSLFQKPIVKMKLPDLMIATRDFHPDHIIVSGSSRIGTSYQAVLQDGSALTVKRLHCCPLSEQQFRAEMGRMGQLCHPNLVPLLGFCVAEDEWLLIYKHMQYGALSTVLHAGNNELDWPARLRIGIGAARGLAWIHHGFQVPLLHQNLSSAVVLLDEDYEPRITEFGIARLARWSFGEKDWSKATQFLINRDFGEFGYVPPDYATSPVPSTKDDVFGFGVILLELVTGQKALEVSSDVAGDGFMGNLVDWVTLLSVSGRISEAIDPLLRGKGHDGEIVEFLKIASSCIVPRPEERPLMSWVYQSLKSMGPRSDQSEPFDEFPLLYGNENTEAMQFISDDAEICSIGYA